MTEKVGFKERVMVQGVSGRFLFALGAILAVLFTAYTVRMESAPFKRAVNVTPLPVRFIDETGLLSRADVGKMNAYLQWAYKGYGIDMRFQIVKATDGQPLEDYAVAKVRSLGVGSNTGARGLFCVYDITDQRMRIEVGPKLEGILTDAFISYLERENTHAYVNANDLGLGLNLTFQLIVRRLQEAELGQDYDPRPAEYVLNNHLLAEGAGATASVGENSTGGGLINRSAPPRVLRKYTPQPTVELAWQKYLEWESEPFEYVDVPLFTKDTQDFLRHQPMSRAYFDFLIMGEYGQAHITEQVGDVAMMVFTRSPFISPYYFRRTAGGWQMDIAGAIRNSNELIGNVFTWRWRDGHDDYSRAFGVQVVQVDNILRVKGSDNRPLPVHVDVYATRKDDR